MGLCACWVVTVGCSSVRGHWWFNSCRRCPLTFQRLCAFCFAAGNVAPLSPRSPPLVNTAFGFSSDSVSAVRIEAASTFGVFELVWIVGATVLVYLRTGSGLVQFRNATTLPLGSVSLLLLLCGRWPGRKILGLWWFAVVIALARLRY